MVRPPRQSNERLFGWQWEDCEEEWEGFEVVGKSDCRKVGSLTTFSTAHSILISYNVNI